MRIIKKKIHAIAENNSFFTEKTLKQNNFILLFSLLLFVFAYSIIKSIDFNNWLFDIIISAIVLSGVTSLKFRKKKFIRLSYFGFFTLLFLWLKHFIFTLEMKFIAFNVLIFFFIYITYSMIAYVAKNDKITSVLILNAINSYLLIGIIGGFLFTLLQTLYQIAGKSVETINFSYTNTPRFFDYIYYSFITLTTVGYGEVTPAVPAARSLAILIGISGQLYLTVLVAILVGKFLSNNNTKKD